MHVKEHDRPVGESLASVNGVPFTSRNFLWELVTIFVASEDQSSSNNANAKREKGDFI